MCDSTISSVGLLGQTKSRVRDLLGAAAHGFVRETQSEYDRASDFKELKVQIGILSGIRIGNLT